MHSLLPVCRDAAVAQVSANGLMLEVESLGDVAAPAVLLIMGLGMQLTAWPDSFCERLVDAGFRVIRFDNRDIGLSSSIDSRSRPNVALQALRYTMRLPVRSDYSIDDMAADSMGLLDALGVERAHVVGASMGGMIAQNLAARYPQRVLSLTSIMSSSGRRRLPLPRPRVLRLMLTRLPKDTSMPILIEHYVKLFTALSGPGFKADEGELRERLSRSLRRSFRPAGTLRQLLAVVASGDRSELLHRIRAATLILHGDADPLLHVAHGRDCARKIRASRLVIVPGMGHDLPASLLGTLEQHLLEHLRRNLTR
jgi:pimeloyl-ACP methyl ester carboxylesterase